MTELSQAAASPADADARNWVDRFAPGPAKPYLRLMRADRPIGTWLLLIPCWQGIALAAAGGAPDWPQLLWFAALFAVGATVMRGAGCAYNDIVDKDFDAKVARTALRPIPSGQISLRAAWGFLAALCLVGLAVLLQFNPSAIYLGIGSLALVAAYPFMKRVTWWPQAWLGLTFNWGALLGFATVAGAVRAPAFALYAAGIAWTLGYDTIYAHQDKEDDALIGVKSSARALGRATKPALALFYSLVIAFFALAGALSHFGALYYAALLPAAAHFAWQIVRLDIDNPALCLAVFKSNRTAGLLLLAPLLLEAALPNP
ncbi:MAG: 4-hydroxybenzoate octaprenyltransferase [Alphaproteobacteria bacterium]|nr:4-hydroxybenzoate octaprenyltransferase [Alphaproteobacteria bacterium]